MLKAVQSKVFFWGGGPVRKISKATISFVLSVLLHGTTRLSVDGFSLNLMFKNFSKIC